ncbi:hypothetical protein ACF1E9_31205 [Streptomyces roseolus]|uniref:hypothetical protein n=1 Tax=Streptomyces TaxID=1883 RepID=UPI0036E93474
MKSQTKVTRGADSPAAALAMVLKLAESAQARWRAITAPPSSPSWRRRCTTSGILVAHE